MSTADARAPLDQLPPEVDGVPVRETLRALFSNRENGKPNAISKAGCWALALKSTELGRAALGHADESSKTHILWNAWREAFPSIKPDLIEDKWVNAVDFAGVDFRAHDIDFSLCHFGDAANFMRARWGDRANFMRARWGDQAIFIKARWGNDASFNGAQWGDGANLNDTKWGDDANFSGAQWGDYANFSRVQWGNSANFSRARWGNSANFSRARWGAYADFEAATWGDNSLFEYAIWKDCCKFRICRWGYGAAFNNAAWGGACDMMGSRWGAESSFYCARWGGGANFLGCQWAFRANFTSAVWGHGANFEGAQWSDHAKFVGSCFLGTVDFSAATWGELEWVYDDSFADAQKWATDWNTNPDQFSSLTFQGARFGGRAIFSNRHFKRSTLFNRLNRASRRMTVELGGIEWDDEDKLAEADAKQDGRTHFAMAPEFHGCTLHQDTSFDDASFPKATGNPEAARAYRTLKLAFSKQQAVREEQRFFQYEMAEESQREPGIRRWLFRAYQSFSDFGFSVGKPVVVLLVCAVVLGPVHTDAFQWCVPIGSTGTCDIWQPNVWANGFWYGTPLGGLHPTTTPLPTLQMLGILLHKTISIVALFLTGLALRNLFKLK